MHLQRDKSNYYIQNQRTRVMIYRDLLITLLLWGIWFYIMYPLVGIILWKLFHINIFFYYSSTDTIEQLTTTLQHFLIFGGTIVLSTSILIVLWGYYNQHKFKQHKNKRKKDPLPIGTQTIADSLGVDAECIQVCHDARYIQVYHTDKPTNRDVFKKFDKKNIRSVQLYFSNNWNQVREESQFGYTHYKK